jgi:hypothetical protein
MKKKSAPPTITPRGMTLKEVCAYLNVSRTILERMLENRIIPQPLQSGPKGKQIFDRVAIDAVFDRARNAA